MIYKINDTDYLNLNKIVRIVFPKERDIERELKTRFNSMFLSYKQYSNNPATFGLLPIYNSSTTIEVNGEKYIIENSEKGFEYYKKLMKCFKSATYNVFFYETFKTYCIYDLTMSEIIKLKEFLDGIEKEEN